MSENMAAHLKKLDIAPGSNVGFQLKNSIEQCALMWAIALCGATVFPIRYDSKSQEVEKTLEGIELTLIVIEKGNHSPADLKVISIQQLLSKRNVEQSVWPETAATDHFYMCHSSGTTGKPKTFVFSQKQFRYLIHTYQQCLGWDENDRFFFDMSMGDAWGGGCAYRSCFLALPLSLPEQTVSNKPLKRFSKNKLPC